MVPPPPDFRHLAPLFQVWRKGDEIIRVYNNAYAPAAFNPGKGAADIRGRFHFFTDSAGAVVPALYGSDLEDGALSETVFHDVPIKGPHRAVLESRLKDLSIVTLRTERDLRLAELLGFGLSRFGLRPEDLTTTPASEYPQTIGWAQALHAAFADLDGLLWMSKQFNAAKALVLFGDRVAPGDLTVVAPPLPLSIGPGRAMVDDAANRAGITII
jgi:RES domain